MQSDDMGLAAKPVLWRYRNHDINGDPWPWSYTEREPAPGSYAEIEPLCRAAAIERLVAERDEARRDAERLDFLDKCNAVLNAHYGTTYRWRLILNHNVNRLMLGHMAVDLSDMHSDGLPSCRDAIDRARQALKDAP